MFWNQRHRLTYTICCRGMCKLLRYTSTDGCVHIWCNVVTLNLFLNGLSYYRLPTTDGCWITDLTLTIHTRQFGNNMHGVRTFWYESWAICCLKSFHFAFVLCWASAFTSCFGRPSSCLVGESGSRSRYTCWNSSLTSFVLWNLYSTIIGFASSFWSTFDRAFLWVRFTYIQDSYANKDFWCSCLMLKRVVVRGDGWS